MIRLDSIPLRDTPAVPATRRTPEVPAVPGVGTLATERVLHRLSRLALPLLPGVTLRWDTQGDTDLGVTVASLCAWAQSGALGDWEGHEDAADALLTATEVLYRAPLGDAWGEAVAEGAAGDGPVAEDPVACVLAAAWSRLRVCRGESVTLAELARLASVSPSWTKALAARGEIVATVRGGSQPAEVSAAEARRWLAARGLAGW